MKFITFLNLSHFICQLFHKEFMATSQILKYFHYFYFSLLILTYQYNHSKSDSKKNKCTVLKINFKINITYYKR